MKLNQNLKESCMSTSHLLAAIRKKIRMTCMRVFFKFLRPCLCKCKNNVYFPQKGQSFISACMQTLPQSSCICIESIKLGRFFTFLPQRWLYFSKAQWTFSKLSGFSQKSTPLLQMFVCLPTVPPSLPIDTPGGCRRLMDSGHPDRCPGRNSTGGIERKWRADCDAIVGDKAGGFLNTARQVVTAVAKLNANEMDLQSLWASVEGRY